MKNRGAIVNRVSEVTDEMVEIASHTYVGNGGGSLVNGFVRVNMRDALTAILPMLTAQSGVPDGWKLVPIIQTSEMETEGAESLLCGPGDQQDWRHATAANVWGSMVKASPEYKL